MLYRTTKAEQKVTKASSFESAWLIPLLVIERRLRKKRALERWRTQSSCMKIVRRSLRWISL